MLSSMCDPHVTLPRRQLVVLHVDYGSKSKRGTEVAAVFYSLIESAKLVGVEPKAYLRAAAVAALTAQPPLLPHAYKAAASDRIAG